MFRSVLFTILWGSAVAVIDSGLDRHWVLWKKIHSKVYSHEVEKPGYTVLFLLFPSLYLSGVLRILKWSTVTLYFRSRSWLAGGYGRKTWR